MRARSDTSGCLTVDSGVHYSSGSERAKSGLRPPVDPNLIFTHTGCCRQTAEQMSRGLLPASVFARPAGHGFL